MTAPTPLELTPPLQAVVDKLQGCGKAQRALLRDIRKAGQAKGVQPLLELVMRHRAEFGETFSRRFCLASLPGCPPAIPLYERAFGPLSPFERERYQALHAELNRDYPQAGVHWQCCLEHLQAASGGVQEPLTEALIHRHIAELATLDVPRIAIDHLEKSLKVDPDDKPTYLHLIKLYERLEEAKTAQIWLNRALEQYPKDPEVLILAMQSAQRRKAFKQVVAYAKTLLDIDPINRQARRFLLEAHLAHARKLLKSKNPATAEKELAIARQLDPQRRHAALLYLEGLLTYLLADNEGCRTLWREAWELAGGGLEAWLGWALEVLNAGLPLTGPDQLLTGLNKQYIAKPPELLAFAQLLERYARENRPHVGQALKNLRLTTALKRSFKQTGLTAEDYAAVAQGLAAAGHWDLLAECMQQGKRRLREYTPLLDYYAILARCRGDELRLNYFEEEQLDYALETAHEAKDHRTATLISGFLLRREQKLHDRHGAWAGFDVTEEEEDDGPMFLPGSGGRRLADALDEQLQQLLGQLSPEELEPVQAGGKIEEFFKQLLGGGHPDLAEMLGGWPGANPAKPRKGRKQR